MRNLHLKLHVSVLCMTALVANAQSEINTNESRDKTTQISPSSQEKNQPAPDSETIGNAEIRSGDSLDSLDSSEDAAGAEKISKKLLSDDTPDWVKHGLLLGDEHSLAISSSLFPSIEQCREDLKLRMMHEVNIYLREHVLQISEQESLPKLDCEYVEKFWVNPKQVFDNVQEREGVVYHQLWIGLHISADQLKKVRDWEKQNIRESRTAKVGVMGGIGIGAISLLSGLVGFLARRERAKLKL